MMFVQHIYLFHHGGKSNPRCEEVFNLEITASRYDTKGMLLLGIKWLLNPKVLSFVPHFIPGIAWQWLSARQTDLGIGMYNFKRIYLSQDC